MRVDQVTILKMAIELNLGWVEVKGIFGEVIDLSVGNGFRLEIPASDVKYSGLLICGRYEATIAGEHLILK